MGHPYFDLPTPIPIGHRGCAGAAPENTLDSFERALADGAAILESDVHLSRDGVPVLIHDDVVDRTTDGTGRIRDLAWAELARLDAGHRFVGDGGPRHPFRGRGLRIPTLAEALEALPGARFNLELKETVPGMVERCIEAIVRAGRESLTLLTAGDDALMGALRARVAEQGVGVALGACTADVLDFVRTGLEGGVPRPGPMALQIPPDFGGRPLVTAELVAHAHRHGAQVHVWTINDPAEMARLFDLGVDGIISDHPRRVVEAIAARRGPD